MKNKDVFDKARGFIYRNARPIDLARWRFFFEEGSGEDVLKYLAAYQNTDGGFGHALEADSFNPNSSPVQTWQATNIIREIGLGDPSNDIIKGILKYLDSGADFDEGHYQWLNCVPSNNDYPHAVWWGYAPNNEDDFRYNPTASLAGFIIKFADKDSELYQKGIKAASMAYDYFKSNAPFKEEHITACFIDLYEYCEDAGADFIDISEFKSLLIEQIGENICAEPERWEKEYVPRPSRFIKSTESLCYDEFKESISAELEMLARTQLEDGSYPVTWNWFNDYKEFPVSENFWKSSIIIDNMLLFKNFEGMV